ncbi:MAG: hotdog fold domain-containing protein [Actinomycetota bacterium]|nr:hotdog fold domain-containing protein [Actinomycetota bacterium]
MSADATVDRLSRAIRAVQDSLPNSTAPDEVGLAAAGVLEQAAALLEPYAHTFTQSAEWSLDEGKRGVRSLAPALIDPQWEVGSMQASIVFTNFFHGANGAAHGGSIPLIFDEILGRIATAQGVLRRTAYLKVDFRHVTPVNKELHIEGHLERNEGRKFWFRGSIHDGQTLCAEAEGLWVALKPGAM